MKLHYCQAAHVKLHGLDVLYDQMKNEVDVCKGIRLDCRIPGFGKGFKVESQNFAWHTSIRDSHDQCKRIYRKSSFKLPPPPLGVYLFKAYFRGRLIETGGYLRGGGAYLI